jgi:hypothetical protein
MILFNIGYTYLALPLALDFQRLLTAGRAANRTPATAAADAIVTVDVRQSDVRGLVPAARALLEGGAA